MTLGISRLSMMQGWRCYWHLVFIIWWSTKTYRQRLTMSRCLVTKALIQLFRCSIGDISRRLLHHKTSLLLLRTEKWRTTNIESGKCNKPAVNWGTTVPILIYELWAASKRDIYRGITLSNSVYKLFESVLLWGQSIVTSRSRGRGSHAWRDITEDSKETT